jgi:hypothetical protein
VPSGQVRQVWRTCLAGLSDKSVARNEVLSQTGSFEFVTGSSGLS